MTNDLKCVFYDFAILLGTELNKMQEIMKFTNVDLNPSLQYVVDVIWVGSLRKSHS
jgi:hypothetical protein